MGWAKGLSTFGLLAAVWTFTPIGDDEGNTKVPVHVRTSPPLPWEEITCLLRCASVIMDEVVGLKSASSPPSASPRLRNGYVQA